MNARVPGAPRSIEELEERLSEPRDATVGALRKTPGDIVILGAGGKMGPTLARMAIRAATVADSNHRRRVIAVSRFASATAMTVLERVGVEVVRCDLLDLDAVGRLPDAPNVIFMAGQKFGTTEAPGRTWMVNVAAAALCAHRYRSSRIVAFSTGNVYPLVPAASGGATEVSELKPVGDYAASCVAREGVFTLNSHASATRAAIMRLNYAVDLRYGVLTDIALRVHRRQPVDLAMGSVNVIWQGDANRAALELLPLASCPPLVLNVSGGDTLSVRTLAQEFGKRFGVAPEFSGTEAPDALLTNTAQFHATLGTPEVGTNALLDWVADWVQSGLPLLDKPTHFETRTGAF